MYFTHITFVSDYTEEGLTGSCVVEQWKEEWEHTLQGTIKLLSTAIGVDFFF